MNTSLSRDIIKFALSGKITAANAGQHFGISSDEARAYLEWGITIGKLSKHTQRRQVFYCVPRPDKEKP